MRLLLGFVLALGVLWGGYWFVGSSALDRQLNGWFDDQTRAGHDIGREALSVAGFPNRFDVTVTAPYAHDPVSGWGWKAPFVQVFSMTWKPWHVIAALPPEQTFTTPAGETMTLTSRQLRGSLLLHPGLALALDSAVLEGTDLALTGPAGAKVGVQRLVLAAGGDPSWKNGLRLGLQATDLAPDPARLAGLTDLGPRVADTHLDATLQLSAPIDRHLGDAPVHVVALHLTEAHMTWGPLVVSAKGSLSKGMDGRAEGKIALTITDWARLPDALVALGVLPVRMEPLATRALTLLDEAAGKTDPLQVPLELKGGRMTLGALPLGAAPMLP
jgi:hypothetical protein